MRLAFSAKTAIVIQLQCSFFLKIVISQSFRILDAVKNH